MDEGLWVPQHPSAHLASHRFVMLQESAVGVSISNISALWTCRILGCNHTMRSWITLFKYTVNPLNIKRIEHRPISTYRPTLSSAPSLPPRLLGVPRLPSAQWPPRPAARAQRQLLWHGRLLGSSASVGAPGAHGEA